MARKPPPEGVRFGKGQKGNPGGRPSTKWFRDFMNEQMPVMAAGVDRRRQWAIELFETAMNRRHPAQFQALALIGAYDMGKPVEPHELSGPEGGPVETKSADLSTFTSEQVRKQLEAVRAEREKLLATTPATNDTSGA